MNSSQSSIAINELLANTAFRKAEKKYKLYRYDPKTAKRKRDEKQETDFSDLIDFRNLESNTPTNQRMMKLLAKVDDRSNQNGKVHPLSCYAFDGVPGLLFFPNALDEDEQKEWCERALTTYGCSPPYPNNMTNLNPSLTTDGYCKGMRWATLGYKYNWTTKSYDPNQYTTFPTKLLHLIHRTINLLAQVSRHTDTDLLHNGGEGIPEEEKVHPGYCPITRAPINAPPVSLPPKEHFRDAIENVLSDSYDPQTAIVNYFPLGSSMCAHQDLSEPSLHRPLISLSLGCSCVFLMGTTLRTDPPHAFLLRSGDFVAFTGPSRVAFHAVPRILDDCPKYLNNICHNGVEDMMKTLRININVRQVYDGISECIKERDPQA